VIQYIQSGQARAPSFSIVLVVSLFNREITQALQDGAVDQLSARGFHSSDITVVEVPGAVEIPIVAQKLASKGKYSAIVALGAVIRGETSHYDYVCQSVTDGCLRVSLDFNIPVIFGVLTMGCLLIRPFLLARSQFIRLILFLPYHRDTLSGPHNTPLGP
jgi:6,7-dimethyl-8-ribityllumazine synthase